RDADTAAPRAAVLSESDRPQAASHDDYVRGPSSRRTHSAAPARTGERDVADGARPLRGQSNRTALQRLRNQVRAVAPGLVVEREIQAGGQWRLGGKHTHASLDLSRSTWIRRRRH